MKDDETPLEITDIDVCNAQLVDGEMVVPLLAGGVWHRGGHYGEAYAEDKLALTIEELEDLRDSIDETIEDVTEALAGDAQ